MPEGATRLWAHRLDETCPLKVVEAEHAMAFEAGCVYVARAGRHLRVRGTARKPWLSLELDFADVLHVPSIDFLMSSAAEVFGSRLMGVLLTGMGSDGALGMLSIRRAGGVTLSQSEDTAFMSSMPLAAEKLGAVGEIVPLDAMTQVIVDRVAGRL
jgi:two-component system chemotaxis response regulator CheB